MVVKLQCGGQACLYMNALLIGNFSSVAVMHII
jgi:hypothetical protein